ncbi:MAG: hypothetical protein ACOY41_09615 [Pseudomonadota bacterium]
MSEVIGLLSGLLKLISSLFSTWETFKRRSKPQPQIPSSSPEAAADRFVRVFEAHGVRRSQIPLFFNHDLTLASVKDNQSLLAVINDQLLNDAAKLFGVHPEWMYGATEKIYETHDFYKHPEEFSNFLQGLIGRSGKGSLECYAIISDEIFWQHNNGFILIAEKVGEISGRPIFRYHLCDNLNFAYWKSHVDMYACLAIAYQHEVYPLGRVVSKDWMKKHVNGLSLFSYCDPDGIDILEVRRWCPDQAIEIPDQFLEGIDNEDRVHGRGHYLAIERWLSYCADDRLKIYDAEFGPKALEAFKSKLALLS